VLIGSSGRIAQRTIYIATRNADLDEGRGHEIVIGNFVDESVAKRAATGRSVMGTNGCVMQAGRTVVEVMPTGAYSRSNPPQPFLYLLGDAVHTTLPPTKEELRKAAVAKLTPEELAALTT
jgi:hypothetical protein